MGERTPRRGRGGVNQYDLGSHNEATIIETIRQSGSISRTEISLRTGLTQQSVSRILRLLLERGLLVEEDPQRTQRLGKPRTPVRLRPDAAHAVGVLVDPEVVTVVRADLSGVIVSRSSTAVPRDLTPDGLVELIAELVDGHLSDTEGDRSSFLGVGVAVPGPKTDDGRLLDLPLKATWSNVPLGPLLSGRLGCPVIIEKDGTAAAMGERWVGRSERAGDFAYVYMGTGVGCGLILNGQSYEGATGNAGEFGQLTAVALGQFSADGAPRIVPELNAVTVLPQIAARHGWRGDLGYAAVCAAVDDPAVATAVEQVGRAITAGVVALVDLLDLEMIVIGGPAFLAPIRPALLQALQEGVNTMPIAHRVRTVTVQESLLDEEAAALGAASMIFHTTFAPRTWGTPTRY